MASRGRAELADMIDEHQVFVAIADGEIQGLAGWRGVNLRHVYVAPGAERKGIGSQLVGHAERDFKKRTGEREMHVGSPRSVTRAGRYE